MKTDHTLLGIAGIPALIKSAKTMWPLENEIFCVIAIITICIDYPCMYSFALECTVICFITFVEEEAQYRFPAEYSAKQHMDLLSFSQD